MIKAEILKVAGGTLLLDVSSSSQLADEVRGLSARRVVLTADLQSGADVRSLAVVLAVVDQCFERDGQNDGR